MVFSGEIYTAVEMHEMGVVDVLAEDRMGEQAVYDFRLPRTSVPSPPAAPSMRRARS